MSLEALRQELRRKSGAEAARIESDGKADARAIREEAKRNAQKFLERAQEESKASIEMEKMRIPAARLKARRIIQDSKYEMVRKSLGGLPKLLDKKAFGGKKYEMILTSLIEEGMKELGIGDALISVQKGDGQIAKKFGKVKEIRCIGGAIISSPDGRMRIDNTFEALIEKRRQELEQMAFEILFSKEK